MPRSASASAISNLRTVAGSAIGRLTSHEPRRLRHGVAWATVDCGKTLRRDNDPTGGTRVVTTSTMTTRLVPGQETALVYVSPQTQTALTYVRGALFNPVSL